MSGVFTLVVWSDLHESGDARDRHGYEVATAIDRVSPVRIFNPETREHGVSFEYGHQEKLGEAVTAALAMPHVRRVSVVRNR